jgi:glutathione synthetase
METMSPVWPPQLTDTHLEVLVSNITDYQITHGSMLKLLQTDELHTVLSNPVGVTLFPTLFPLELFNQALTLQKVYNKLYAAAGEDQDWLHETLKDLIAIDPLTGALWSIHEEIERKESVQDLILGIFRSDYMLHIDESIRSKTPVLKQVEFNTIACAGGIHSNTVSNMHHYLHRSGTYQLTQEEDIETLNITQPQNNVLDTISSGLAQAHSMYISTSPHKTCVLMVVQPNNFNIADERPIEYALWDKGIPTFRIEWGPDIFLHTQLTEDQTLLYHPPHKTQPLEVSVIYYRAGFQADEYDANGIKMRLRMEYSRAIKCPPVLAHLTTLKKVQQALAVPGALERFLEVDEALSVRKTFVTMYPLDESDRGEQGRKAAMDPASAEQHVLKPSLEGGGHNIYGSDIPLYLEDLPPDNWNTYILQEKITPPAVTNYLMSSTGFYQGPVISELGVFGVCLWRSKKAGTSSRRRVEIVKELDPCCSFKSKNADVDEMSVVKGYGCFDSPALVEMETFVSCSGST